MPQEKMKSFKDLGALRGSMTTDAKAELLLKFITKYQNENVGGTPSYETMANEIEVPREAVLILLKRLENRGDIHFISRNPPRIMLPNAEAPQMPSGKAREGAYDRFMNAEAMRMKLGRFIAEHEGAGKTVTLRMMMDHVGFDNAAYVTRMAEILVDRGLLEPAPGATPTKLSAKGREYFKVPNLQERMMDKKVIVVPMRGGNARSQMFKFCELYADYLRETGDYYAMYKDLAERMGFSAAAVSAIAGEGILQGWFEPKAKGTRGLFFTEKGLRKFMPEEIVESSMIEPIAESHTYQDEQERANNEETVSVEPAPLAHIEEALLVMELLQRGYTVKKN